MKRGFKWGVWMRTTALPTTLFHLTPEIVRDPPMFALTGAAPVTWGG